MLDAAERTGADLVSGLCLRVHTDSRTGKTAKWYPWLYRQTRTFDSIAEIPDLLVFDTLSTNKCYRREFLVDSGLTFPRGIHYEDLLFSAQAYLAASRITLIPNTVYHWNVVEKTEEKSISNRRHEINNFADRLEIHRRIDRILVEQGHDELKLHKDTKFLKHDLVLYLRDLPFLDDDYRHHFAQMANGYIQDFPEEAYAELSPIHRLCAYLLLQEDWDHLMPAIDTLINKNKVSSPLLERDGRVYWCAQHLDDPMGRAVLDVTDLGYHAKPVQRLNLRNAVTRYAEQPAGVTLAGALVNPLGVIAPAARACSRSASQWGRCATTGTPSPGRPRCRWRASCAPWASSTTCGTCACTSRSTASAPRAGSPSGAPTWRAPARSASGPGWAA
jgi:CDP-glycerol glycerophosphotransferase